MCHFYADFFYLIITVSEAFNIWMFYYANHFQGINR